MSQQEEITLTREEVYKLQEQAGNIRILEHVNLANTHACTLESPVYAFFMKGLQCTRDPRLAYHFWANFGRNQFHLFTGQKVDEYVQGLIYLYVPELDEIEASLTSIKEELSQTKFAFERVNRGGNSTIDYPREKWQTYFEADEYDHLKVTGPFGNEFRVFTTPRHYWSIYKSLGGLLPNDGVRDGVPQGLPFIQHPVRPGLAHGISRFFEYYLGAVTSVTAQPKAPNAEEQLYTTTVSCGPLQALVFQESESQRDSKGEYDGHHVCIHIDDFKNSYEKAFNDNMQWNNLHFFDRCDTWFDANRDQQYRILNLVDPKDKTKLMAFELEIRSAQHFRNIVYRPDESPEDAIENERKRKLNL